MGSKRPPLPPGVTLRRLVPQPRPKPEPVYERGTLDPAMEATLRPEVERVKTVEKATSPYASAATKLSSSIQGLIRTFSGQRKRR